MLMYAMMFGGCVIDGLLITTLSFALTVVVEIANEETSSRNVNRDDFVFYRLLCA